MRRMDSNYKYLVCVKCMTFNQHAYIEDAMNGFCMQETAFPFVCVIVDDASTDGEQDVIKAYIQTHFDQLESDETNDYFMVFGQHKTNKNCWFVVFYLKYNHYSIKKSKDVYFSIWQDKSKYIAYCEGDDYWIDANKLQLQVDFLDKNDDYGMCYMKVKRYYQEDKRFASNTFGEMINGFEDLLINGNRIPTLTVCVRRELWEKYGDEIWPSKRGWLMGDYPMWLYFSHEAKIKFIDRVSGVYRVLNNSASHIIDKNKLEAFIISYYSIKLFFKDKYNVQNNNSINFDYHFYSKNREECVKIDCTNLSLKYRIKSICCKSAILWRFAHWFSLFKRTMRKPY